MFDYQRLFLRWGLNMFQPGQIGRVLPSVLGSMHYLRTSQPQITQIASRLPGKKWPLAISVLWYLDYPWLSLILWKKLAGPSKRFAQCYWPGWLWAFANRSPRFWDISIQRKHLLSLHPAVVILLANWTWRQYKTFGLSPPVWRQWQPRRPFLPPTMKIDAELVHECPWPRSFRRRNWWWKWKNTNRLQPMPSGSAVYRWVALGLLRSTEFTVPLEKQGNRLSGRGRIHSICKLYNVYIYIIVQPTRMGRVHHDGLMPAYITIRYL